MSDHQKLVCPHCDAVNRVALARIEDGPVCGACKQPLIDGKALALTAANFDRQVAPSDWPVLVDFWAPWCAPCRSMAPVIEAAAGTFRNRLRVAKVDTEAEGAIAARFGIRSIPTLIIFEHGKIIAQQAGAVDAGRLSAWVNATLAAR